MKPVITFFNDHIEEALRVQLQNLGKQKEQKGVIEYMPKNRKATEVIRILRENGIQYEIRFDSALT
jgi:hypothetical protein